MVMRQTKILSSETQQISQKTPAHCQRTLHKQRMRNDTAEKLLRPAATSHPTGT